MADEPKADPKTDPKTNPKADAKAGAKPPPQGGLALPLMIGVVVGALAIGGAVGGFLVGPRIISARSASAPTRSSEHPSGGKQDPHKKPALFKLDNLIVNPAGSQGTRFLMATVAIELPNDNLEEQLRDNEIQVRDRVTSILENQTLEMLTRPGARDSLRLQLAVALKPMAPGAAWVRVYLPQLVIQ